MTSPIKPPGGGPPNIGIGTDVDAAQGGEKAKGVKESVGESFKATLDKVGSAQSPQAAQDVGGAEGIAAALKAGEIDSATAVELLIARALETPASRALNEAGRAALEVHLREALQNDPALGELVDDFGK